MDNHPRDDENSEAVKGLLQLSNSSKPAKKKILVYWIHDRKTSIENFSNIIEEDKGKCQDGMLTSVRWGNATNGKFYKAKIISISADIEHLKKRQLEINKEIDVQLNSVKQTAATKRKAVNEKCEKPKHAKDDNSHAILAAKKKICQEIHQRLTAAGKNGLTENDINRTHGLTGDQDQIGRQMPASAISSACDTPFFGLIEESTSQDVIFPSNSQISAIDAMSEPALKEAEKSDADGSRLVSVSNCILEAHSTLQGNDEQQYEENIEAGHCVQYPNFTPYNQESYTEQLMTPSPFKTNPGIDAFNFDSRSCNNESCKKEIIYLREMLQEANKGRANSQCNCQRLLKASPSKVAFMENVTQFLKINSSCRIFNNDQPLCNILQSWRTSSFTSPNSDASNMNARVHASSDASYFHSNSYKSVASGHRSAVQSLVSSEEPEVSGTVHLVPRVELVEDSGVFITKYQMTSILLRSKGDPGNLIRNTLDALFAPEELGSYSACGLKKGKKMPENIVHAIKTFTLKHCKDPKFDTSLFNKIINSKCGSARRATSFLLTGSNKNSNPKEVTGNGHN